MVKKFLLIASSLLLASCSQIIKDSDSDSKETKFYPIDTGVTTMYLIKGEKNVLIDTSVDGQEQFIEKKLKSFGIKPRNISLIILTHAHGDHAGNVNYFKNKYRIPVMIGDGDQIMTKAGKNLEFKTTGLMGQIVKPFVNYTYKPFEPDILLKDKFSLKPYGIDAEVIKTGGHTEGSLIVVMGKNAFVGDLIRGGMIFHNQPTLHFFHVDQAKSHSVMKNLINQGVENFYPSHWGPLTAQSILDSKVLEM